MFRSLLIQDPVQAKERYDEMNAMDRNGRKHRLMFCALCAVPALFVCPMWMVLAWVSVIFLWELCVENLIKKHLLETNIAKGRAVYALRCMDLTVLFGACLYATYAVMVGLSGHDIGRHLAIAWLIGSILHGFVYYSNTREFLLVANGPPTLLLIVLPPLQFGLGWEAVIMVLMCAYLIYASSLFALDRNTLLAEIESRKRQKEEADAANTAKSRFLTTMSHELRTPLNAVIGYAEIIAEDIASGTPPLEDDAKKIKTSALHLLNLINQVLDMSKIEAGAMELNVDVTDIAGLTHDVAEIVRPLAIKNHNQLNVFLDPTMGTAIVDALKVRQCLVNLASNACKFTHNGTVSIAARRERTEQNDQLSFTITDTGVGMTPEVAERAFEPFTQADNSITRSYEGTGLGLSITRALAQRMCGDVTVSSKPGVGSVFTLTIQPTPANALEAFV